MAKKFLLGLLMAAIIGSAAFAQEKYDGSKKNTIFFGGYVGYERSFTQSFSAGAEMGFDAIGMIGDTGWFLMMPFSLEAFGRWYPWQRMFFAQLGLGLGVSSVGFFSHMMQGFLIKPQAGWKIDIGEANAWILELRAGMGFLISDWGLATIPVAAVMLGRMF